MTIIRANNNKNYNLDKVKSWGLVREEKEYPHWLLWIVLFLFIGPFVLLLLLCPTRTYAVRFTEPSGNKYVVRLDKSNYTKLENSNVQEV